MIPSIVASTLFVLEQLTFLGGASLMWRIYRRYRFPSYSYMFLTFLLWSISSAVRLVLNVTNPMETTVHVILWIIMNFNVVLGIITTFYSFFYFHYNKLPGRANIASILGGATLLAFCNPEWFQVSYLAEAGIYIAKYAPVVNLFAVPLIVLFIIVFLLPIVTKYRLAKTKKTKQETMSLLIVLTFLLIWAALPALSSIAIVQVIRPYSFAGGWIVWIILTKRRPLTLIFTQRKFEKILVMTDSGYPVLLYDFATGELGNPDLFSALFSALQSMMKNLISSSESLRFIYYENRVVSIERRTPVIFLGIGDEPDTALLVALRVFADNLLEVYGSLVAPDGAVIVRIEDEAKIREVISRSFEKVIF